VLLFAYLEFTAVRARARWQHTAPNN
jgi:hypothetical protein